MGLVRRWFGGARQADTAGPFSPEGCLARAGWQAARSCELEPVMAGLGHAGFALHEAARRFLGEYYGLRVDVPIAGADEYRDGHGLRRHELFGWVLKSLIEL